MSSRKTALWLLAPVLLVGMLVGIILSPLGGRIAVTVANQSVPGLSIERASGSLLSALTLHGIEYQLPAGNVSLAAITLDLSISCLFEQKLCIQQLSLDKVAVVMTASEPTATEPETSEPALISLPIALSVDALNISKLEVSTPAIAITASNIATQLTAHEKILLPTFAIAELLVQLPAQQQGQPQTQPLAAQVGQAPREISYALDYKAPQLSDIYIPVDAQITDVSLPSIILQQNDDNEQRLSLSAASISVREYHAEVANLQVSHTLGNVELSTQVDLVDSYAISAELSGAISKDGLQQSFTLASNGNLADLALNASTSGTYSAQLDTHINLLDDQLPLQLQAQWPQQSLPDQLELSAGSASINGQMGNYAVNLDTAINHPKVGLTPIVGDIHITRNKLKLVGLNIDTLQGSIINTGELRLDHRVTWQGTTQLTGLNLSSLLAETGASSQAAPASTSASGSGSASTSTAKPVTIDAPTNISGELTSLVVFADNKVDASIRQLALTGEWQSQPLDVTGNVTFSSRSEVAVGNLTIKHTANSVTLTGQVFKQRYLNLDALIDIAHLHALLPDYDGTAQVTANIVGDWTNPQIDITSQGLSRPKLTSDNPTSSENQTITFDLNAKGDLANHTIALNAKQGEYRAEITANNGTTDLNAWQSNITVANLFLANTQWQLLAPFTMHSDIAAKLVNVSENCWQTRHQGQLCLEALNADEKTVQWQLNAEGLPAGLWLHELSPQWLPQASSATLAFNSQGSFALTTGTKDNNAVFSAQLSPATWYIGNDKIISIGLLETAIEGQFSKGELTVESRVRTEQLGEISNYLYAQPIKSPNEFSVHTRLKQLNLTPLEPLSDLIRQLGGYINGDIRYTHTQGKPEIAGFLRIDEGAIDIQNAPVALKNWQQTITLLSDNAQFNGSFELGGGPGTLSGSVNWQDAVTAQLNLVGDNFMVTPPDMTLYLSPKLDVAINNNVVKVSGDIDIPRARIKVDELPESAVAPSEDVHLRGEPPPQDPLAIIDADVNVSIDSAKHAQVRIDAFGLTAHLHGNIGVKTLPALVGYGDLQILDGRYQAYGQDLFIQTGEVQFNGPLTQPFLLVEAIRDPAKTEDDVIAGVRIDGSASQPNVNLFSEPAMDQGANLAYLLNGRGPGADGGDTNYNALLLGFGLSSGESLTSKIGNTLGIDDFTVSTTSSAGGNDTKLALSGKINDRLSVQYNVDVGLNNGDDVNKTIRRRQLAPDLTVKYQLRPRLFIESIQTTIEEQTEFAVDLYYRFFVGEEDTKPAVVSTTDSSANDDSASTEQPVDKPNQD